jgi:endonuclease YncB( thermonuclease family)
VGLFRGSGRSAGSLVLLTLVAAVLLRPWEWQAPWHGEPPETASAHVTRVVDGDTIEVDYQGYSEDVRYIGIHTRGFKTGTRRLSG